MLSLSNLAPMFLLRSALPSELSAHLSPCNGIMGYAVGTLEVTRAVALQAQFLAREQNMAALLSATPQHPRPAPLRTLQILLGKADEWLMAHSCAGPSSWGDCVVQCRRGHCCGVQGGGRGNLPLLRGPHHWRQEICLIWKPMDWKKR